MITQETIENILLKVIREKRIEHEKEIEKLQKKRDEGIQHWQEISIKLQKFEKKHIDELKRIYPREDTGYTRTFNSFFFGIHNELGSNCAFEEHNCENEIRQMSFGITEGFINISYSEFEEETGMSSRTIKKYCELLEDKGLIKRKRGVGGWHYKIND